MSRTVHRPARGVRPLAVPAPQQVAAPPVLPDGAGGVGLGAMIPLAGSAGALSMMMFLRGSGFAALGAVIMVVSLVGAAVLFLSQRGRAQRARRAARVRYLDHLEDLREQLRGDEDDFRAAALRRDPPAAALLDVVADPARRWERRCADVDFLRIRVGAGEVGLRELVLRDEGTVTAPTDPHLRAEAEALLRRFRRVPGLPLRVGLDRAGDVSVVGPGRADVLAVARTVLAQVVAWHAAEDVTVAVLTTAGREADWDWARWLPHLLDRHGLGVDGPTPLIASTPEVLGALLADDLAARHAAAAAAARFGGGAESRTRSRLLVLDDAHGQVARTLPVPGGLDPALLGVTVVHLLADRLHEPDEVTRRVSVWGATAQVEDLRADPLAAGTGSVDDLDPPSAEGLARFLAPLRLSPDSYDDGSGTPPADFSALHGLGDPEEVLAGWADRGEREFLRVPLGVDRAGRPLALDLKESAALGMGPHGLCVGATGSGKSELLRTLVLGLACTHPPDRLGFVLVDYKGGATFAPFAPLPHVAGLITNLAADEALVKRMHTSLDGEIRRRQQVLADARVTDVAEYTMRRAEVGGAPLPHLLVVIDEFGELLTAEPEFVELFLRIGRIGRSIGVHLLLSSQRIEAGKLRGLDTYLSYRIGLRTLSAAESRTVLDTPDAFALPALPGHGYLKVDVSVYTAFKTAHVSGPAAPPPAPAPAERPRVRLLARTGQLRAAEAAAPQVLPARALGPTLLSELVAVMADAAPPSDPVWLPPLPDAISLDRAAGPVSVGPDGARCDVELPAAGLPVPVGLLDDPARQWQGPWTLDLASGGGHLLVIGGPGTGASTALRTVALGLACAHTPQDVAIYGVDLTGAGLRPLAGLPHVGGVAGRDERERVRRTIDEVHAMLADREALFARRGIDSISELRDHPGAGGLACTDVVLLLDGYGRLAADFESLETPVHDLLARGGRFGVHVVATARRWNEVRAAQQVAFSRRVELRITEPGESCVDPTMARGLPRDTPGRALAGERRYAQFALPRVDGLAARDGIGLEAAVSLVRSAWHGPVPPEVRVLPAVLPAAALVVASERKALTVGPGPGPGPGPVPFGRFERDLTVAEVDLFGRDQHLLVLGDGGSGRTNLLRLIADGLVRRFSAEEIVFAVFDPRRGLADVVPEAYLGGYAPNPTLAGRLAAAVCTELARRDPADPSTMGPRVVLLVDDYDVLAASTAQPLGRFLPFIASGADIGLHVVMVRRVMGAARGIHEQFTLAVRESGCAGLLLSGDRTEGQLLAGVRPMTMPVGRAQLVRPGEPVRTVQTALLEAS